MRGCWYGLLVGSILALMVIIIWHVAPLPPWSPIAAGLVPLPCMLIGLIVGGWRKPEINEVARWVDGKQHLKERLSTALEVSGKENTGAWGQLIMADAAEHARGIDPRRFLPFHLPRFTRWALLLLALAAGLGFVPEYRSKEYKQKQADKENIKQVGKQLAELTRRNLQQRPPALPPTEKAMESVANLGDKLSKANTTRAEALKDIANVSDKLKDELKQLNQDPAIKRLEQAARTPSGNESQTAEGLQKQMESLQKQLGTPTGNPDALDKIQKELSKLQEAAKGLADKNSQASDAEKQKLSDSLAALSKQMQQMGMQLPQLDDAIKALQQNQADMVLKDLESATVDLEKMRDLAKSLQQMQAQMEKMGKDLAEQLKNGQPEIAEQTLRKMADQLKSGKLSKEQMEKILSDVSKAMDPAGNYGDVAKKLDSAMKAMQASNKSGASKSLSDAADELASLMQQMKDAQQLEAALDSMGKASMCIGSGQCWGLGNSACKTPKVGNKPGKGGPGVGTWAEDEKKQWDGQINDFWDNNGNTRADQASRSADGTQKDPGDALKPTKVKGQFSPGGQMPSVTLKGVSIKGQSKVAYEEAAATAQSEAQSALNQDKVPRVYQGAVKDYFDDFKK